MDNLDLSDLLTDVNFIPGVTEVEVKFKPKNINLFIDRYKILLEKMRKDFKEVYEESTVHYYDGNIREIIIKGDEKVSYDTKTHIKDFKEYEDYGFIISVNDEEKVKNVNTRKLKRTFTRSRNRHKFDLGNYVLDMTELPLKNNKTIYEIELEFTGKKLDVDDFAKQIMHFYRLIYNSENIYNNAMTKRLVEQINNIMGVKDGKFIHDLTPKARNLVFNDLTYGSIAGNKIVDDYYVSHKADGLYKKLVFNEDGIWLNHRDEYNLLQVGYYDISLFDCELLNDIEGYKNYVPVFDCLIYNGKFLFEENLKKRTSYIKNISTSVNNLFIFEKPWKQLTLENFFETMKEMAEEQNTLPYPQDGFMFTQGGKYTYNSDKLPLYKRKMLDVPDLCKWKPYNRITIDFRVMNEDGYVTLYVYDANKKMEVPFNVPKVSDSLFNQEYNNKIVECIYDSICNMILPIKIRPDKPVPNQLDIARSNWNAINDPISIDDLCGNSMTLVRKYHNQIKNMLYGIETIYPPIEGIVLNNYKLLDIGGGRGGDLTKWEKSNASKILTVEPNNDNLDELKRRLVKSNMKDKVSYINTIGEDTTKISKAVEKVGGLDKKVDAVSLMLSLSFFFSDDEHLDALVQTIVHNLKEGGLVLFLTIDGSVLKKHLDLKLTDINVYYTLYDKKYVMVEIPGIVGRQWEFLVDLDKLTDKLGVFGIELVVKRVANDELLLSEEAKLYSSLFSYGYYKKVDNIIPKNVSIKLPKITYPDIKEEKLFVLKEDELKEQKDHHLHN